MTKYDRNQMETALNLQLPPAYSVDTHEVFAYEVEQIGRKLMVSRSYRRIGSSLYHFEIWTIGPRGAAKRIASSFG
jgi:hypothetical protein